MSERRYKNILITTDIEEVLTYTDTLEADNTKYILIGNNGETDIPLSIKFEGKEEYNNFKEKIVRMDRLTEHFKREDKKFISICMINRYNNCNGCKFEKLCEELCKNENRSKSKKHKKLPNSSI